MVSLYLPISLFPSPESAGPPARSQLCDVSCAQRAPRNWHWEVGRNSCLRKTLEHLSRGEHRVSCTHSRGGSSFHVSRGNGDSFHALPQPERKGDMVSRKLEGGRGCWSLERGPLWPTGAHLLPLQRSASGPGAVRRDAARGSHLSSSASQLGPGPLGPPRQRNGCSHVLGW